MKNFITALIVILSVAGKAQEMKNQKENELFLQKKYQHLLYSELSTSWNIWRSLANPALYKQDSVTYYVDSLETEVYARILNQFQGDSIVSEYYFYEADTIYYASKNIYYMDNTLPELLYDPLYSGGGRKGNVNGYSYSSASTIGDTLSILYIYDFETSKWDKYSKANHYISSEGIDTLAKNYLWDTTTNRWELNNLTQQKYVNGIVDSIYVLMLTPNLTDTINYDIFTFEYDSNDEIILLKNMDIYGYTSTDTIIYNSDGLIEISYYKYAQHEYNYGYQFFYDSINRVEKLVYLDKQEDLSDWVYDGHLRFYYPEQTTETTAVSSERVSDSYIYPNPCSEYLKVTGYSGKIEVYNSVGQLMLLQDIVSEGTINTSMLPKGLYMVKMGNSMKQVIVLE